MEVHTDDRITIGAKIYEIITKPRKRRGKATTKKTRATSEKNMLVRLVNWKEVGILSKPAPFPIYLDDFKRLINAQTIEIKFIKDGNETEITAKTIEAIKDQFTKG